MPNKPAHLKRWQVTAAFVANVVAIVVIAILLTNAINNNHNALKELKHQKASVIQLETTNCRLRTFMREAASARMQLAQTESRKQARIDNNTAAQYLQLVKDLSNQLCRG
jgi:hypothetical protein